MHTSAQKERSLQMNSLAEIAWLAPWQALTAPGIMTELHKEVGPDHPLYQQHVIAIGQRSDCDDVLLYLPESTLPYAVVHLTWSGTIERTGWPHTRFYASLEEWLAQCMQPDHQAYCAESAS